MFKAMFTALKRVLDNSFVPILMGAIATVLEWLFEFTGWLLLAVSNLFLGGLVAILNLLPIPADFSFTNIWTSKFLAVAEVVNLWEAIGIYVSASVLALILKIVTVGVIKK